MKRIFTLLTAILVTVCLFSQAPQKLSYQAVVRNASNDLVTNALIGIRISVLQGSTSGAAVYIETQTANSNLNGLISIEIGGGTAVTGAFSGISWATGPYFLKTEIDPAGGTNYSIVGTSQLLSVPYSLYSELGGFNVKKLHQIDELNLIMTGQVGPNVPGSSTNIGDISPYKGLILEWRMNNRPEVFHQVIYLSPRDKDIILGRISPPANYPRRYTTILADGFATMMWLGVSIQGTQLYLSTNSVANPTPRLQRIYGIL
jgi:hypothetical protein